MNGEELLAHAKRMYPVGTKYRSPDYGTSTVNGELRLYNQTKGYQITDGHGGSVHLYGEWAEVLSYPLGYVVPEHINNTFPIY